MKSDIFYPEFFSQMVTQAAIEAGQLFNTHDYTDVYIGSEDPIHQRAAKTARAVINKTLNRRKLWFFSKYMRAVLEEHWRVLLL